ncbi:MAG: ribonuclease III family protein [Candidatus Rokubacteria bacterium]|nr:ribonuclease III family protein [Candidatus Rokubacteria bacterium]MBI3028664.1 ribonuclease III family protein [Candidatus Rokubacteria bacterium]
MASPADPIPALEERLGHRFKDRDRLLRALTHTSYANEQPPALDNDSLAFLGDAVLSLIVAEHLWETAGVEPVGVLTPRRASVVSDENLARWAERLELGPLLRLGRGEEGTGGRAKASILATALEAVLAVVYLEDGLAAARVVVKRLAVW